MKKYVSKLVQIFEELFSNECFGGDSVGLNEEKNAIMYLEKNKMIKPKEHVISQSQIISSNIDNEGEENVNKNAYLGINYF